jgi:hypothetical protein
VARIVEHMLQTLYRGNHAREVHLPIVSLKYVYKGYEFSRYLKSIVYLLACRSQVLNFVLGHGRFGI